MCLCSCTYRYTYTYIYVCVCLCMCVWVYIIEIAMYYEKISIQFSYYIIMKASFSAKSILIFNVRFIIYY